MSLLRKTRENGGCPAKRERIKLAGGILCLILAFPVVSYGGAGWVKQEDGWHYYLEENVPGSGWIADQGRAYYLLDQGLCLTDSITPDGYYVDSQGAWYERKETILGGSFTAPGRFAPLEKEFNQDASLLALAEKINQAFGSERRVRVGKDQVEYVVLENNGNKTSQGSKTYTAWQNGLGSSDSKSRTGASSGTASETVLAGLYRDQGQGYYLDLKLKLYPDSRDENRSATYDYALFKGLLYQVSSSPELLEEAILSAWQGDNRYQIGRQEPKRAGDALIRYTPGDGFGRFFIYPAGGGN